MGSGHSLGLRQSDLLFLKGLENEGETILQRKDDFMIDGTTLNKAVSHRCRQKKTKQKSSPVENCMFRKEPCVIPIMCS